MMDILSSDLASAGVRISASGRVSYPEDYAAYAAIYQAEARTVRAWVAKGKTKGELPPLPIPSEMPGWWKRRLTQRIPAGILAAATASGFQAEKVTAGAPEDDEKKARGAVESAAVAVDIELSSAEEALRQAREMAHTAYVNLREAQARNDVGSAEMWRKDWSELVETQRKWEKDYNAIMEQRGLLVRKSAVQVELAGVANVLSRAFLASMQSLLKVHCPDMAPDERTRAAVLQRDRCFDVLRSGYFGENLVFEA